MKTTIGKMSYDISKLSELDKQDRKRHLLEITKKYFGTQTAARALLEEFLKNIINDTQPVFSSFNPNGFFKVTILRIGGTSVRLHVISKNVIAPDNSRTEENIHDHRWSFSSVLLTGRIEHEIYGISKKRGDPFHQYSYYPRGEREYFSMNYHGRRELIKTGHVRPEIFKPIMFDSYKLHRAIYPWGTTTTTATLVIADEDRAREYNYIFATDEIHEKIESSQGRTPSPHCSLTQTIAIIEEVLTCI
jgi:hypothetical protein